MLSKITDEKGGKHWYKMQGKIEYVVNNIINKSTGKTPSQIIFGLEQRGSKVDCFKEMISCENQCQLDRNVVCAKAADSFLRSQAQYEKFFNSKRKAPYIYKPG